VQMTMSWLRVLSMAYRSLWIFVSVLVHVMMLMFPTRRRAMVRQSAATVRRLGLKSCTKFHCLGFVVFSSLVVVS
jgi:hypothetical protein